MPRARLCQPPTLGNQAMERKSARSVRSLPPTRCGGPSRHCGASAGTTIPHARSHAVALYTQKNKLMLSFRRSVEGERSSSSQATRKVHPIGKKQGAWQNAGGPGSASSTKREPIYDKETGTLYGLNPMELDALKQRFSMRASPQEDSLDPASSKEDDEAPEQDDVPGQDGWRKDGWREDDWGRDGWREDTWDNDGWREDGSGKDDSGKGDWLEGSGGKDSWGKDSWGKAEDTGYHGDENDDGEDKGVDDHGGKRKGKWWQGHQQDEWHDKSKTTSELEESYCAGCDCYDCDCLKAKEERDDETMSNSDEPGSASSSARASFKHPGLRDAMEKWAEQASIRENKVLDIVRKANANQQREARDTHREWLDRKYLKRTLKRLAKYDELGLAKLMR